MLEYLSGARATVMDQLAREILQRGVYIDLTYQYKRSTFEAYDRDGRLYSSGKSEDKVIGDCLRVIARELGTPPSGRPS